MAPAAKAKAGAGKKAGPPPAEQEPQQKRPKQEPGSGATADQNRMMSSVRYHAKSGGPGSEGAALALQLWGTLPVPLRQSFYNAWMQQQGDKASKNSYKFVYTFQKQIATSVAVSSGSNKHLRNGGEILADAGLRWSDYATVEDAVKSVQKLVDRNRREHPDEVWGADVEDPDDPRLSRWWWIRDHGVDTRTATEAKSSLLATAQCTGDQATASSQALLGLESDAGGAVLPKAEDPETEKFRSEVGHLKNLLASLSKELTKGEILSARLQVKAKADEALSKKSGNFVARLAAERAWMATASVQAEEWSAWAGKTPSVAEVEGVSETCSAKVDALRLACREAAKFV